MNLLVNRSIYRKLGEIWKNNQALHQPSVFYDFLAETYVAYVVVAVRRLVDGTGGTVSLRKLLDDVRLHATLLTREWFVARTRDDRLKARASQWFDRYGGENGRCVAKKLIERDVQKLESATKTVVDFGNENIAHSRRQAMGGVLTYGEIDASIDVVVETLCHYYLLVNHATLHVEGPVILDNWTIFTIPWVERPSHD